MIRRRRLLAFAFVAVLGCRNGAAGPTEPPPEQRIEVSHPGEHTRFAVIGDFGEDGPGEAGVAKMVAQWEPDFVITVGDNNYQSGAAATIDTNIGKYYHAFIAPYHGKFGAGAKENRFFPTLGNHDWRATDIVPYLDYFALPGNERYYHFRWGPVGLFAIDSDQHEPDGITVDSKQAKWLHDALAKSDAPWKVVYMHHPPYSSGRHGSSEALRWPYFDWGASVVISGHDHHYERIERGGGTYVIDGLGGNPERYPTGQAIEGSVVRFHDEHGAMIVDATPDHLAFEFITVTGKTIDKFELSQGGPVFED